MEHPDCKVFTWKIEILSKTNSTLANDKYIFKKGIREIINDY